MKIKEENIVTLNWSEKIEYDDPQIYKDLLVEAIIKDGFLIKFVVSTKRPDSASSTIIDDRDLPMLISLKKVLTELIDFKNTNNDKKSKIDDGLYNKYIISKTDGSEVDKDAKYFVLRYDDKQKNKVNMKASLEAIKTYAEIIDETNEFLAYDLMKIYNAN